MYCWTLTSLCVTLLLFFYFVTSFAVNQILWQLWLLLAWVSPHFQLYLTAALTATLFSVVLLISDSISMHDGDYIFYDTSCAAGVGNDESNELPNLKPVGLGWRIETVRSHALVCWRLLTIVLTVTALVCSRISPTVMPSKYTLRYSSGVSGWRKHSGRKK